MKLVNFTIMIVVVRNKLVTRAQNLDESIWTQLKVRLGRRRCQYPSVGWEYLESCIQLVYKLRECQIYTQSNAVGLHIL